MAAYAEWRATHVKEDKTFVYVTISTGISCSIIHRGSFLGGRICWRTGFDSCPHERGNERLEKIAAGPGIQRIAERDLQVGTISTKDVFASYINGVPEYQSIINEVTDYLAQGLYKISCLLDPHRMVLVAVSL